CWRAIKMKGQPFFRTFFHSESDPATFSPAELNQRRIFPNLQLRAVLPGPIRRRQSRSFRLLTLLLSFTFGLILTNFGVMAGKDNMERDIHILLIRGLSSEVAVAKVPFPRGRHGVSIDSKGNLDQSKSTAELRLNGVAISPGMPVEITKVA